MYGDSDVDTHLNVSSAGSNEVLSWNGSDYDWVSNAGYTNSNVDTHQLIEMEQLSNAG